MAPRIPDYAARRASGERIDGGGGKAVDLVAIRRPKAKRGRRWGRGRVEAAVAPRVALLDGAWDPHHRPRPEHCRPTDATAALPSRRRACV